MASGNCCVGRQGEPVFPSLPPPPSPTHEVVAWTQSCPGPETTCARVSRLHFWNLEFESRSFLYRQVGSALSHLDGGGSGGALRAGPNGSLGLGLQVRRMTAVLVAVGLGALRPAQVKVILESRDPLGRHQARVAPAHGLFLKSVLYENLGKSGLPAEMPSTPTD